MMPDHIRALRTVFFLTMLAPWPAAINGLALIYYRSYGSGFSLLFTAALCFAAAARAATAYDNARARYVRDPQPGKGRLALVMLLGAVVAAYLMAERDAPAPVAPPVPGIFG